MAAGTSIADSQAPEPGPPPAPMAAGPTGGRARSLLRSLRRPRAAVGASMWVGLVGLAIAMVLGLAAERERRSHRAAVERVLHDYALVAGTEFMHRAGFDLGFDGYEVDVLAIRRTARRGSPGLPADMYPKARALVHRLLLVEDGRAVPLDGAAPLPPELASWGLTEASRLSAGELKDPFVLRHRVDHGRVASLVLVPLESENTRVVAFDVAVDAQVPYFSTALQRDGPLLPASLGEGNITNAVLRLSLVDAAGREVFHAGAPAAEPWQADVPFGRFFYRVLDGAHVRVVIDRRHAARLVPGGLPPSRLPLILALLICALAVAAIGMALDRRARMLHRLREDFIVSVSHDLRTPLAQMRLFTEALRLRRFTREVDERWYLDGIWREALRLSALVDNILDAAILEGKQPTLALAPTRLAPLVATTVESFGPLSAVQGIRVVTCLDESAVAPVDERALRRILLNLLDNAAKFSPAGGQVTVRLERADNRIRIVVEDRGPGVPADQREAIFRKFVRLERDRQSVVTGAGIGLTIVRHLATAHGGACTVEDAAGGGARFVVDLPASEAGV